MRLPKCKRIDIDEDPGPLLADGWREIEELVTYEREPAKGGLALGSRVMDDLERSSVIGITALSFSEDRLHKDPEVSRQDADQFKIDCVRKAFNEGLPILTFGWPTTQGFLVFRFGEWLQQKVAILDLMAVLPDERGKDIGKSLVIGFLHAAYFKACHTCRAGTQAHNTAACKLYESLDFKEIKRERTFHK